MKLITKLTIFNTASKLAIVVLFVFLLPSLVDEIVSAYTNRYLQQQRDKVVQEVNKNGVDYYLQGQESYGSYTMLKEEYISLEPYNNSVVRDTIETSLRVVENDTLTYRVLKHVFTANKSNYLLEVGKTTATISEFSQPLQRLALFVLVGLIFMTILLDLLYTRHLLKPLNRIIFSRIVNARFPFRENTAPVSTTTTDFAYLDKSIVGLMEKIKDAFDKEREFTSNASHELMTPVSILQNKLENLMVQANVAEETQDKISGMMITLNRLKKIVRSLLLISRIENDQYVKGDTVDISKLVCEVVNELADRAEAKNLKIDVELPNRLEVQGVNHELIFLLFYNLVNNAIRYNREGGAICVKADNSGYRTSVSVEDTGMGIRPEDIHSIFNRFKKSHRSSEEGYGLGLSIVKSIADYHMLQVTVDSVMDKGTVFRVTFPEVPS